MTTNTHKCYDCTCIPAAIILMLTYVFLQVSDATLAQFSPSDLNTVSSSVIQEFLSQLLTKVQGHIAIVTVIDFVSLVSSG